jgi:hypothetical protein
VSRGRVTVPHVHDHRCSSSVQAVGRGLLLLLLLQSNLRVTLHHVRPTPVIGVRYHATTHDEKQANSSPAMMAIQVAVHVKLPAVEPSLEEELMGVDENVQECVV